MKRAERQSWSSRKRTRIFAFITIAFSVLLSCVGLEAIVRVTFWNNPAMVSRRWTNQLTRPRADREWYLYPPQLAVTPPWSDDVFRTNSLGFRDRDYSTKAADEIRIAMIGDSFTKGNLHAEEACYAPIMEFNIRKQLPDRRLNVLNGGHSGTGTLLQFKFYEKLLPLEPDIIVVNVFLNDFWDDQLYRRSELVSYDRRGLPKEIRPPGSSFMRLLRRSYLFCKLEDALGTSILSRGSRLYVGADRDVWTQLQRTTDWSELVDPTAELLDRWRDVAVSRAQEFYVVLIPAGPQVSLQDSIGTYPVEQVVPLGPLGALHERLDSLGIGVFSLLSVLTRESSPNDPLYLDNDLHWSRRGNELAGRKVAEWLSRSSQTLQ